MIFGMILVFFGRRSSIVGRCGCARK